MPFDSCFFKIHATGCYTFRFRHGEFDLLRLPLLFDAHDATNPLIAHPFVRS